MNLSSKTNIRPGTLEIPCSPSAVDDFLSEPSSAVVESLGRSTGDFMVLGAAGKMGLHVCLMLRKALDLLGASRRVIAVSRFSKPSSMEEFRSRNIEVLPCDLSLSSELKKLPVMDNIVFMAGAKFGTSDNPGLLKLMNEEMPERVAEHFRSSIITAFSTGCVYSYCDASTRGATELSPTEPIGEYANSCLGRERAFTEGAKAYGTRVSLIRLNYSVELRYGVPVDIVSKILNGREIDVTMGHVNLIWQRDAVIHSLLAHEYASDEPFIINVSNVGSHKIRDLAARLGDLMGREVLLVGTEEQTAWISDASKAVSLFGKPEVSVDQILEWVAAWQMAGYPTLNKPTGFENRDGKF